VIDRLSTFLAQTTPLHHNDYMWGGWCSNAVIGSFRVRVWKNIRRGVGGVSRFVKYEVGDGFKIKVLA
jgi:hypothetical protein